MSVTDNRPVLFASEAHAGLFGPLAAIAGELARRGADDLWFASMDTRRADVEAIPGDSRVRFASLGSPPGPELDPTKWSDETYDRINSASRARSLAAYLGQILDPRYWEQRYRRVLEVIDEVRPSLMMIDSYDIAALDAAMTRDVRFMMNCPTPVSYLFARRVPRGYPAMLSGLPLRMTIRQRWDHNVFKVARVLTMLAEPKFVRKMAAYLRLRKQSGVRNATGEYGRYADAAVAVLANTVFGIEYPFPVPPTVKMLGTMVSAERGVADGDKVLFDWLDARESVVYIGLGTLMRVSARTLTEMVAAIEAIGPRHHVLWSMTKTQQGLLPAVLPSNLRVESWVPQVEVLAHPHVRGYWTHGGNSSHQGLHFGKPLLTMPGSWETRDLAVRFVDAGAALMVADVRTVGRDELVRKLSRLLTDENLRERAGYWRRRLTEAGGVGAAADLIAANRQAR
ncbi:glycosyltransferase [Kibdelosporangium persicum]|uniref:UDP-glucoronosyl and UDP-glucosyl transferase n=1 Tax=Kibdelosporangium persicum TaxID=2698649 RepID=A0ABX2FIY0_9PSEU|nr:glycosyltransferase [Kibdelosporangium persicum]NRN71352.1 UDP-glucoronosyl and UDP-glucosyl transferase [Kibdelosporangium persicum]